MVAVLLLGAVFAVAELPVDPKAVGDLVDLGLFGWLVLSIIALVFGYVPTKGRLDDEKANRDRYEAELTRDRDEWKAIAKEAVSNLDRIADLFESRTK